MLGKLGDPWMHEPEVIIVPHPDRLPVGAGIEYDLFVLGEGKIHNSVNIE
jgi:hypothetical protein